MLAPGQTALICFHASRGSIRWTETDMIGPILAIAEEDCRMTLDPALRWPVPSPSSAFDSSCCSYLVPRGSTKQDMGSQGTGA